MERTAGERIAVIEKTVLDMHQRLFGNHQPGELAKLDGRMTAIEQWHWKVIGGMLVLGACSGLVAKAFWP